MIGKDKSALSLSELLALVRNGVENAVPFPMWVSAEVNDIKLRASGHCYLELSDTSGDEVTARASAVIWSSSLRKIKPYFESETGRFLEPGMKILAKVQVTYSELYSLSLVIVDIEPSFSVGEQEIARRRTIARLEAEGMFEMNRTLELPSLPRRFAVISSETAAGYRDFMKHLHENPYGFRFVTELFPAQMQGSDAPASIISAMDLVASREDEFDALMILRGGGSKGDLSCYDDYGLAANIAQFPLPVLVGVGHDYDVHVCDMVANCSVKTPTALADVVLDIFSGEDMKLESLLVSLRQTLGMRFSGMSSRLDVLEQKVLSLDPENVLKRGYVILLDDEGRRFSSASGRNRGDKVTVMLADGSLDCKVMSVKLKDIKSDDYGK